MNKRIWLAPISLEELQKRNDNTLASHLGIEFTEIGDDFISAKMPIDARTLQPAGILHGGASCVLAETVGSVGAAYCVDPSRHICVGLDININHIRAMRHGNVMATGRPLHLGKSTQVWEILIKSEKGELVSVARLTIAILAKK